MAGRGMGAASRGGGAVSSGPKNKMVSEPSKSTGKVLMMAKGGDVNQHKRMAMGMMGGGSARGFKKGGKIRKYQAGGFVPPMNPQQTQQYLRTYRNAAAGTLGTAAAVGAALSKNPYVKAGKVAGIVVPAGKKIYDALTGSQADQQAFLDSLSREPTVTATPENQGEVEYRRGGAVRKKDYMKKKAKMMRKGGMSDKKGRAMKSKSKDSRGRAMRGY